MIHKNHNLSDLLQEWGRKNRQMPTNSETVKNNVLAASTPSEKVSVQRPTRFLLLGITGAACAVVLFFSGSVLYKKHTTEPGCRGDFCNVRATVGSADDLFSLSELGDVQMLSSSAEPAGLERRIANSVSGIVDSITKPSIKDTREFLKTDYAAFIRTRAVEKLHTQIQTMIRGYGGRVDTSSVDQKNAEISFIIPKSSLDAFRLELADVAPTRFITENIRTQNLLSQKQTIENQTEVANKTVNELQEQREKLVTQHTSRIASLQQQINNYGRSITALKNEVTTSTARQEEITKQISSIANQQYSAKQALNVENSQYQSSLQKIESDITAANSRLVNLGAQDQELLNTVETVEGYISLQWISVFDVINLYIPIYWILIISCVCIIFVYVLYGRRRSFELP